MALGLTGAGGSLFTLPLLVYGLHIPTLEAVTISLAATGGTALVGAVERWRSGEVAIRVVVIVALAGFAGAPLGTLAGAHLARQWLMGSFALLMVVLSILMWRRADRDPTAGNPIRMGGSEESYGTAPACGLDTLGRLDLTPACTTVLAASGLVTGFLSGLFGVGGGFLIVPALTLAAALPVHTAVATSLPIIALVGGAGFVSHLVSRGMPDPTITITFWLGGLAGIAVGGRMARRLAGPRLQKVFALMLWIAVLWIGIREWGVG